MTSDAVTPQDLFVCQNCGQCCKGYGGTYITEPEIDNICRYLGMDRKRFMRCYCQMSGGKPLIAQAENGYCVFWDQQCTIHPVKPHMCRQWPFIESILVDAANWQIMAASCPGMRAGFSEHQIQNCVRQLTGSYLKNSRSHPKAPLERDYMSDLKKTSYASRRGPIRRRPEKRAMAGHAQKRSPANGGMSSKR